MSLQILLGFRSFFLAAIAVSTCSVMELKGAETPPANGSFFQEAAHEFKSMSSTGYQHRTQVDRIEGSYHYDCVGFVSYALRRAAPQAWKSIVRATGIRKGCIPSPPRYRTFFATLPEQPQPGWEAILKASELRPGDIVAWEHRGKKASGHAVVIAGVPTPLPGGEWLVAVYDSTSSPHGEDSRPNDPRTQILASTGRHGGLGHGLMVFTSDPVSDALTGLRWSPKAKAILVPIAAARPVS